MYELFKDFAGPIATFVAATVAAGIAWYFGHIQARIARQQAEIAAVRLQHDLYDRRYEIFKVAWSLLVAEILPSANVSDEAFRDYVRGTAHAAFLVGREVQEYLTLLRNEALRLRRTHIRFKQTMPNTPERQEVVAEQMCLFNWFEAQLDELIKKFEPLLSVAHYQLPQRH